MDPTTLAGLIPQGVISQGAPAPNGAGTDNNQAQNGLAQNPMGAPAPDAAVLNNAPVGDVLNNGGLNIGAGGMVGMNPMGGLNNMGMLGNNANMGMAGLNQAGLMNPNDLMNAVLMSNLQQQAGGGGMGAMNPLVLQTMLNQGMNPAAAQMGMGGMNLLAQQGMMNPLGMGMANLNALGGVGMDANNGMVNDNNNPPVAAPGSNTNAAQPAPAVDNKPPNNGVMDNNSTNNGNDLLAQLMQNPMALQMMAQGMNPMMLLNGLGGVGGMLGGAAGNPLGALGLGGLGGNGLAGLADPSALGAGGLNLPMMANATTGDGTTAPHPNALFAFNNPAALAPQDPASMAKSMVENGALKQPISAKGKKGGKKTKVKGKPKRPLSAYNFFFREERSRILDSLPKGGEKMKNEPKDLREDKEEKKEDKEEKKEHKEEKKEDKEEGGGEEKKKDDPTKSTDKDYDQVGDDGKKIPHGKIGFENLAKLIGRRWQELDAAGVEKYKKLADEDMTRYKKEMEIFLAKEAQENAASGLGVDGDLMAPSFYSVMNQKKRSADDDSRKPKKKRGKVSVEEED